MNKRAECQFFGASSLYNKVSRCFNEVPNDQYDLLKNKLLEKLLLYASKCDSQQVRLIQRKLNSTLAKLALYLIVNEWENCVSDIIQTIPNCINENDEDVNKQDKILGMTRGKIQLIAIVIDLFTLLPEEYNTLSNLNKTQRTSINSQLKKNFHLISQYLLNLFNELTNGGEVLIKAATTPGQTTHLNNGAPCAILVETGLKCLNSWIEFGVNFCEIQAFVDFLFISIYHEPLFETSAQCLTTLFNLEDNTK